MNFDAHRAVWAARDAGALPGGSALLVGLAMADRTDRAGQTRQGVRTMAERVGVSPATVVRAVRLIVAAGLYEIEQRGTGHRVTRYRLACHWDNAGPVDNRGLALHGRNAIAFHGSDLAFQNGLSSVSPEERSNRTVNASLGISVSRSDETPPVEVPDHVAMLRASMRAHPSSPNGDGAA